MQGFIFLADLELVGHFQLIKDPIRYPKLGLLAFVPLLVILGA